jgi:hypothetical protein
MGVWTRVRELASGPRRRILAAITAAYHDELRVAQQLRLHAEHVPYPNIAARLLALADQADARAVLLRERATDLGGAVDAAGPGAPRGGRNCWERLTVDLGDLRAQSKRYLELAQHWDIEDAETAALFARLAREDGAMCRVVGDLVARSDPHAQD